MKHHPPPGAVSRARKLRRQMTPAERMMWNLLRNAFEGAHFRKQVPIRHFIVDFASHPARLVIEVDGGQHNAESDSGRTEAIEDEGYRVLRFWNNDVLDNRDGVHSVIASALLERHPYPNPPPSRGREK